MKKMICIECPKGCDLTIDIEGCRVIKVTGNQCPKGEKYAISEIENPVRVLTSTVLADGLSLKMIPVRTNKPIHKSKMAEAMSEIKKIKIDKPVKAGDIVLRDLLGLGIELVSTRDAGKREEGE